MNVVTECINNIKMLKLYAWIDLFMQKIVTKRTEELAVLWSKTFATSFLISIFNFWPIFLQAVSLVTFIGVGNTIDLETVYTVIALFNVLRGPISMLPWFFGQMIEFTIAMRRI